MFRTQALIDAYLKTISTDRVPLISADKKEVIQKNKVVQKTRISNIA